MTNDQKGNTIINDQYDEKGRFASYWHQINEVQALKPDSYLEIGIGTGIVYNYLRKTILNSRSLDINANLKPDLVGSVLEIPAHDHQFDVTSCCQVLEHLPYSDFTSALKEIKRVTRRRLILSLPDLERRYRFLLQIPKFGTVEKLIEIPRSHRLAWEFNGEHYWNIGTGTHSLTRIRKDITQSGWMIQKDYCVFEMPWHRFFILSPID